MKMGVCYLLGTSLAWPLASLKTTFLVRRFVMNIIDI